MDPIETTVADVYRGCTLVPQEQNVATGDAAHISETSVSPVSAARQMGTPSLPLRAATSELSSSVLERALLRLLFAKENAGPPHLCTESGGRLPGRGVGHERHSDQPPIREASREARRTERRAFPRRDSGCVIYVHRWGGNSRPNRYEAEWLLHASRLKGELIDISMNGVAFVLSEQVEMEERLLLRMANHSLDTSVDASATVVRTVWDGESRFKVVCRFDRNLSFEQVHALGQHLAESRLI